MFVGAVFRQLSLNKHHYVKLTYSNSVASTAKHDWRLIKLKLVYMLLLFFNSFKLQPHHIHLYLQQEQCV